MKNIKISFFLSFFLLNCLQAQLDCGDIPVSPQALQNFGTSYNAFPSNSGQIKVYFHIYALDNGSGGVITYDNGVPNYSALNSMITKLNAGFASVGFSFFYNECEVRIENNSNLLGSTVRKRFFFRDFEHEDGIDIHVTPDNLGYSGISSGIPGGEIAIGGVSPYGILTRTSNTLIHEMGHALGLFHTHRGIPAFDCEKSVCEEGGDIFDGDYVQDTPYDPGLFRQFPPTNGGPPVVPDCDWDGTGFCMIGPVMCIDPVTGNIKTLTFADLNPQMNNYMSYAYPECTDTFTDGQIARMKSLAWNSIFHNNNGSHNCCPAGNEHPELSAMYEEVTCPFISFNLNSVHIGTIPDNSTLVWSLDNDPSDGIEILDNTLVFKNGNYFAYYYNSDEDCYSPSADIEIEVQECCMAGDDMIISGNETLTQSRVFQGDVIIQSGATLTLDGHFQFVQGKKIVVENGGALILMDNTNPTNCPNASSWMSIIVNNGGALTINNAFIIHAHHSIRAFGGSHLNIQSCDIVGLGSSTGTGIWIDGNVTVQNLKEINISHVRDGIFVWNGADNFYHLDDGSVSHTTYAVTVATNSIMMHDYDINQSQYGVLLYNGPASLIYNNNISANEMSLLVNWSPYTYINSNIIGSELNPTKIGMSLYASGSSVITYSLPIRASQLGIRLWSSDAWVTHNLIQVQGASQNTFGGGIQVIETEQASVSHNYVDVSFPAFGIETVGSAATEVSHNEIDHYSNNALNAASIRSMESIDDFIANNVLYGSYTSAGILAQNSSFNQYFCNAASLHSDGISILSNSEIQNIIANDLQALTDLVVKSEIGPQIHHSNNFFGGTADASGLNVGQLAGSQFFVNGMIGAYMPQNIIASGEWFIDEYSEIDNACYGHPGPEWEWNPYDTGGDPDFVCRYYDYLKSQKEQSPKRFLIRLYHLMKYIQKRQEQPLPDCIKNDTLYWDICGIKEMVDVEVSLAQIYKPQPDNNEISQIQMDLMELEDKELIDHKIGQLKAIKSERLAFKSLITSEIDTALTTLEENIAIINCDEEMVKIWKEVYTIYIKFLVHQDLSHEDKADIQLLAQKCSDVYGDAVHIARAIANTFDDIYYDAYDHCIENIEPRSSANTPQNEVITIAPNPTTGEFTIDFGKEFEGKLTLSNAMGETVLSIQLQQLRTYTHRIDNNVGLYFVRLESSTGIVTHKKLILIR